MCGLSLSPCGAAGPRGEFGGPDAVADLGRALAAIPAQRARGFGTFCVKPSQFLDDATRPGSDRFAMIWCDVLTLDRLCPYDPAYGRIRASRIQGPAAAGRDSAIRRVHGSGVLIGVRPPVAEGGLDGTDRPRQDHRVRLGFFT